jgi:hypothetical protein
MLNLRTVKCGPRLTFLYSILTLLAHVCGESRQTLENMEAAFDTCPYATFPVLALAFGSRSLIRSARKIRAACGVP